MTELTRNDLVSVGTSDVLLSTAKPRTELVIRNSSAAAVDITIALQELPAEASKGIVLAQGATYAASASDSFKVWDGQIHVIASAVGASVSIFER